MSADEHESGTRVAPGFARRLSYYVFGIAIGLLMLGLINQARHRAKAHQAEAPANQTNESETRSPDEQAP